MGQVGGWGGGVGVIREGEPRTGGGCGGRGRLGGMATGRVRKRHGGFAHYMGPHSPPRALPEQEPHAGASRGLLARASACPWCWLAPPPPLPPPLPTVYAPPPPAHVLSPPPPAPRAPRLGRVRSPATSGCRRWTPTYRTRRSTRRRWGPAGMGERRMYRNCQDCLGWGCALDTCVLAAMLGQRQRLRLGLGPGPGMVATPHPTCCRIRIRCAHTPCSSWAFLRARGRADAAVHAHCTALHCAYGCTPQLTKMAGSMPGGTAVAQAVRLIKRPDSTIGRILRMDLLDGEGGLNGGDGAGAPAVVLQHACRCLWQANPGESSCFAARPPPPPRA